MHKPIFLLLLLYNLYSCKEDTSNQKHNKIKESITEDIISQPKHIKVEESAPKEIPLKYKIWKTNVRVQTLDKGMPKLGTGYLYWYKKSKIIIIDEGIKSDYNGGGEYSHKTEFIIIDEKHTETKTTLGLIIFDRFEAHYIDDTTIWTLSLQHLADNKYHFYVNGGDMYWDYYLKDID